MSISLLNLHPPAADLQRLVRDGMRRSPRQLPAWMLYDAEGSRLFAEICRQPEYTLTQREITLLEENAAAWISCRSIPTWTANDASASFLAAPWATSLQKRLWTFWAMPGSCWLEVRCC